MLYFLICLKLDTKSQFCVSFDGLAFAMHILNNEVIEFFFN
jgi:hypothetical protein